MSPELEKYLDLERIVALKEEEANDVRDQMEKLWYTLSASDLAFLDARTYIR